MAEILKIVGGLVAIGAVVVLFGPSGNDQPSEAPRTAVSGASGSAGETAKFVTVTPDE